MLETNANLVNISMEEVGNIEELVVPDSEDQECHFNFESPSLFRNDNNNVVTELPKTTMAKTTSCEHVDEENDDTKNVEEEGEEEENNEELGDYKFYKVWFDDYLAKHGFDLEHLDSLDQSTLQEIEKSWLNKQLVSAQRRSKQAQVDLNFIKARHAICKQWLSSL